MSAFNEPIQTTSCRPVKTIQHENENGGTPQHPQGTEQPERKRHRQVKSSHPQRIMKRTMVEGGSQDRTGHGIFYCFMRA